MTPSVRLLRLAGAEPDRLRAQTVILPYFAR
jgi:hypothetical protein